MKLWKILVCAILQLILFVADATEDCVEVLVVALSLRGHLLPLQRIGTDILKRGHRLTLATHEEGRMFLPARAQFASLGHEKRRHEILKQVSEDESFLRGVVNLINDLYIPESISMWGEVLKVAKNLDPDFIFVDIGSLAGYDIAHLLNKPLVVNSPTLLFRLDSQHLPAWGSGFSNNMSIWERFISRVFPRLFSISLTPSYLQLNRIRKDRDLFPFFSETSNRRSFFITVATGFGLEYAHPVPPNVMYIGAVPNPVQELHSYVKDWLDKTRYGMDWVVVVSFGSGWISMLTKKQAWLVLMSLKQNGIRLLLDVPPDIIPRELTTSYNVLHSREWVAKTSSVALDLGPIMKHKAVRVLLSGCGLEPVHSALLAGKPLLCLPILADQLDIATRLKHHRVALTADKNNLETENFYKSIRTLATQFDYRARAVILGMQLESCTDGNMNTVKALERYLLAHESFSFYMKPVKFRRWSFVAFVLVFGILCLFVVLLRTFGALVVCFSKDFIIPFFKYF